MSKSNGRRVKVSLNEFIQLTLHRKSIQRKAKNAPQQQVAFIENWINNYPKKILDYKSPREFLQNG